MKTLDDVVAVLERHSTQFDKMNSVLEKHSSHLDRVNVVLERHSTTQAALTSAVTTLVEQFADRKAIEARLTRVEDELRQIRGTRQ